MQPYKLSKSSVISGMTDHTMNLPYYFAFYHNKQFSLKEESAWLSIVQMNSRVSVL